MADHPESFPGLKGRFRGLRKIRVGDYRVIFAVFGQDVHVLRICHRRDAYGEAGFGPIDMLP
ncbi:MAG: type II toxin-antitoxin system RelE/ParE family toxin [Coprothermobacterota bacterium]|nr:type II toxin-antitoxin system RelE/ParE family toxin [Coprothermobacterota bacterium]